MKKLIIIVMMLIFISACSATSKLNTEEKIAYELVTGVIENFNAPQSVRVLRINLLTDDYVGWFEISAQNGFGATTKTCYYITAARVIFESDYCSKSDEEIDIKKVNEAIIEYIEDKGWN